MVEVLSDLKNPRYILIVVVWAVFSALFLFGLIYLGISAMYSSVYIDIFDVMIRNTVVAFICGLIIGASLIIVKQKYIDAPRS